MAARNEGRVERVLAVAGSVCLLALMVLVVVDVIGRDFFNSPLLGGTELAEVVLGAMIFLFYPVLALRGGHITVDLVPIPRALRAVQRSLSGLIGAAMFGVVAFACGRQAVRAASYGDASAILGIPTSWVLWAMTALSALTAATFLAHAAGLLRQRPAASDEASLQVS
jgi:TRAP-type C4-dicarboxylate transport system permease small subunit